MFRDEVSQSQNRPFSSESHVAIPVAWRSIGILIFIIIFSTVAFLALSDYSRVEFAVGQILPDKGMSTIMASRSGVVTEVAVAEGEMVTKGTILATIKTEEDSSAERTASQRIASMIEQQAQSLRRQENAALAGATARKGQLAAQVENLRAEVKQIKSRIALQRQLVESARKDFDRAQRISMDGFISARDLRAREETLLARRQSLSQMEQSLSTARSALVENTRLMGQVDAEVASQTASLEASRARLGQDVADLESRRAYALRAPIDGTVSALRARQGDAITAQSSLMTIVPSDAEFQVELSIPGSAIGFIETGQNVRLAVDAFPYQRFGTVEGTIKSVSASSIPEEGPDGTTIPVYRAIVTLKEPMIFAFGKKQQIVAGMGVTARIVTEKRSLIEWLFEPLFAVSRR